MKTQVRFIQRRDCLMTAWAAIYGDIAIPFTDGAVALRVAIRDRKPHPDYLHWFMADCSIVSLQGGAR